MTIDEAKTLKPGDILTDEEDVLWEFIELTKDNELYMREPHSGETCVHYRECYELY